MIVEKAIATVLATVFGDNVYPVWCPDPDGSLGAVAGTFAVYTKVGGASFQNLEGDIPVSQPRMQVSIYSTSYSDLKAKESAVNDAMQAANVARTLVNYSSSVPVDGYDQDSRRYFVHMDFYCWSEE